MVGARARWSTAVTSTVTVAVLVGCGGGDPAVVGQSADEQVGEPLPQHEGVLNELNQVVRIPVEVVQEPDETVLTVEALFSPDHPRAIWQFLLSDPAGPPD